MKKLTMALCVILGAFFPGLPASSQVAPSAQSQDTTVTEAPKIDPLKEKDIRKLLELTHAGATAMQTIKNMEGSMHPVLEHSLPAGEYREKLINLFFEKFNSKISAEQMVDLIVPVYDKYFSDQEIKDLIAFYQTPTGQKMSSVQTQLAADLLKSGQTFGGMIGRQTMLEILDEHPDIKQALENARPPMQPR